MVAAMTGVTAEIIKTAGAGITVPCGDVAGVVREIDRILKDESLWQQYSEAARRYAEAHYDAERAILAYERTLAEAYAECRRAPEEGAAERRG